MWGERVIKRNLNSDYYNVAFCQLFRIKNPVLSVVRHDPSEHVEQRLRSFRQDAKRPLMNLQALMVLQSNSIFLSRKHK